MLPSRPVLDTAVTGTVELLEKGEVNLCNVQVHNANASIIYLQLFNAESASDVTLGTTVPDMAIKIEASVAPLKDFSSPPRFELGLCYALTTTATNSTSPGAASLVSFGIS